MNRLKAFLFWLALAALVVGAVVITWSVLAPHPVNLGPKEIRALAQKGAQGVPELIRILQTKDTLSDHVDRWLWPFTPVKSRKIPDPNQRTRNRACAAVELGNLGATASAAIPALTEALRDSSGDVAQAARIALEQIRRSTE